MSLEPSLLITFLPHTSTPLLEQLGERLPIIVTNQNTPAVDYFSEKHDTQAFDRYKRLKNLDLARAVHVLIPEFASYFPEHLRERVHAIPNVVHPVNEGKSLFDSSKTIIALGRFDVQKQFDLLIRSMPFVLEKAPNWHLKIFGRGQEEDNLRTLIRRHSLQRSVLLMGRTAKPLDELRKADLFVIPSSYEGWGLTLTEAMSVGLPCIGFQDCSGVNWILRDGETGVLLRERSAETLADGILHLINDSTLARRCGENARAFVRQFSPEKVYAVWDSLIDGVLR
ncbi:glycosyltransferase [Rhizobium sullae]|uniref:glycosyltransferase n=1 Tax=Rhizobium sullae TaxID=50338 RepID=UPI0015C6336D|nr:glycosyltransferase [Rhizobium sullae]